MRRSAGLLMYRRTGRGLEVLLVHPGGPYFKRKDAGVWSVPKGLVDTDEPMLEAAKREFREETGMDPDAYGAPFLPLGEIKQSNKTVQVWAFEGDCDPGAIESNTFELEWPPRSGRTQHFPEADRADYFDLETARTKILRAQQPLLDRLADQV
jgi:predicted NUDIX family NTP pyrophosphohydrolase